MNGMALCAGAGGLELGLHLALGDAYRTVVGVEWEASAASVLVARQQDGALPPFPIWDSVATFDGRPWRGVVPVRLVPDLLHYPAIERIVVLGPRVPACAVCHGPLGPSNGDCRSVQCEVEREVRKVLA